MLLQGIVPVVRNQVPTEIIGGLTLAALAIPEVMGYTKIAGMPVVTGLYTILIPMVLFALFGSSRHLVVGANSATAAIMAAGLSGLAVTASADYVAYAGLLALMVAFLLILARLVRLGFLADFLSHTVLIGFLTGVGIQVAIGEISGILGIPGGGTGTVQNIIADVRQFDQLNLLSLIIAVVVVLVILGARRINRKIPGALITVTAAIAASYFLDFSKLGVTLLGSTPQGIPGLRLPQIPVNMGLVTQLLPISISMFIVIVAQSAATARAYATRYGEHLSENLDLVGLGLANLGAGLSGTFVVNGSPTKTQMVDSAGGRSQLAQLTTALIVLFVLLFLTGPMAYMPTVVLSAVVFMIGVELIDIKGMLRIKAERPYEFWVAIFTAAAVVFIGVEQGILLAILLSLFIHTRHGYKPRNSLLMINSTGNLRITPVKSCAQVVSGLMIYRFHHSMYYANSEFLTQEVLDLVDGASPQISWFCIDAIAIDDVDYTAAATLRKISGMLSAKGIYLVWADLDDHVRTELIKSGVIALPDQQKVVFDSSIDVVHAFQSIGRARATPSNVIRG